MRLRRKGKRAAKFSVSRETGDPFTGQKVGGQGHKTA